MIHDKVCGRDQSCHVDAFQPASACCDVCYILRPCCLPCSLATRLQRLLTLVMWSQPS